jgi:catechol 2,3-dioxygenase-like lactoylglutathione lyase family enzyme
MEGLNHFNARTGNVDHIAFSASDLPATLQALKAHGAEHVCRCQLTSGVRQVFFNDPNGAGLELDVEAQEQESP